MRHLLILNLVVLTVASISSATSTVPARCFRRACISSSWGKHSPSPAQLKLAVPRYFPDGQIETARFTRAVPPFFLVGDEVSNLVRTALFNDHHLSGPVKLSRG
jgi:hypothetical protein